MDGLIEWRIRQADAVGFSGRFLQQCPAAGNRRPLVPAGTRGLCFSRLLTRMTNAGPYRNAQSHVQWQGAGFLRSQRDALGRAEAEAG
jgi:hypothetical protein